MHNLGEQQPQLWRYRFPIVQVTLALCLFFVAGEQQKHYYEWFDKAYPKAFEIDYAYNPPARLIALLVCGPGILVPRGTAPYDPSQYLFQAMSLLSVGVFWFLVGIVVDRKSTVAPFTISALLWRRFALLLLLAFSGLVLVDRTKEVYLRLYWEMQPHPAYGLRNRFLMEFGTIAWFLMIFAFSAWRLFRSIQAASRLSLRRD